MSDGWAYIPNSDGDQDSPPTAAQVEMLPSDPVEDSSRAPDRLLTSGVTPQPVATLPPVQPPALFQ